MPPQKFIDNEFSHRDREDSEAEQTNSLESRRANTIEVEEAKELIRRTIAARVFHHNYEESKK